MIDTVIISGGNIQDGFAHDAGDIDVSVGGYLTGNVYLPGSDQSFNSNVRAGVSLEESVEDGIRNLITDFVGVTFSHRLTGKKAKMVIFSHGSTVFLLV